MSKSFIAALALLACIGSAQAAEPARRYSKAVTFTHTVSTPSAAPRKIAARGTSRAIGAWQKVDGLDTTMEVAEAPRSRGKVLLFTLSTTQPAPPANWPSKNDIVVESVQMPTAQ